MTQDQVMGILRQVLPFLGGLAVGKGWLTTTQVTDLTTLIFQIAGPVMLIGGSVWAFIANSKKSIVQSASQMNEVKSMTISDPKLAEAARSPDNSARVLLKEETEEEKRA